MSRRLLGVVPSDEEFVDKAETLREFVFRARYADSIELSAPDHGQINVDLCVLPFDDQAALPQIAAPAPPVRDDLTDLTPGQLSILKEIRVMADANRKGGTTRDTIGRESCRERRGQ